MLARAPGVNSARAPGVNNSPASVHEAKSIPLTTLQQVHTSSKCSLPKVQLVVPRQPRPPCYSKCTSATALEPGVCNAMVEGIHDVRNPTARTAAVTRHWCSQQALLSSPRSRGHPSIEGHRALLLAMPVILLAMGLA